MSSSAWTSTSPVAATAANDKVNAKSSGVIRAPHRSSSRLRFKATRKGAANDEGHAYSVRLLEFENNFRPALARLVGNGTFEDHNDGDSTRGPRFGLDQRNRRVEK